VTKRFAALLVLIPTVSLAAWRQESHSHMVSSTAQPAWGDLMGSMQKMDVAMGSVEPSGNDDVDFTRLMLPHHQAAIDMAKAELLCGKDPQMRRLAQEIITDQQSEIELMQLWLKQHRPNSEKIGQRPASEVNKEH